MYEQIRYERKEAATWVTLNRPDAMNSLAPQLLRELDEGLRAELDAAAVYADSNDIREGLAAFAAKRTPLFTGD